MFTKEDNFTCTKPALPAGISVPDTISCYYNPIIIKTIFNTTSISILFNAGWYFMCIVHWTCVAGWYFSARCLFSLYLDITDTHGYYKLVFVSGIRRYTKHINLVYLVCMWGSTYCCEQIFSSMKNIKTAERNRLTDKHLANILRIKTTSLDTNLDNIVARKQGQKSYWFHTCAHFSSNTFLSKAFHPILFVQSY